jgi:hypothetical protein
MNPNQRKINIFVMATSLLIITGLALYYWNVSNILLNSTPSDYNSLTTCPVYSRECNCTGSEIAREALDSIFGAVRGNRMITSFCYEGELAECKCFETQCTAGSEKTEISCAELGL